MPLQELENTITGKVADAQVFGTINEHEKDMRIGEVRQFCQLQPEGQSLMWAAMSQLNLSALQYPPKIMMG